MMVRKVSILYVLFLAFAGAFAPFPAHAQDTSRQAMLKLVPEPLPAGAVVQGPPSFFAPDHLYEYMDGAADIFLLYGVRQLLHLDLRAKSADLTVDVFDMGSPDTAFGMYAAERSQSEPYIAIGAEGYRNKGALNFQQDRYYVKLTGFGDGADEVLEALARSFSAKIGAIPAPPALLSRLPAANRKPHSEQYMPNDPLGHPFLGPAYVVTYVLDGQESKLFVTLAHDAPDARQRLEQLKQHFAKTGQCNSAPGLGDSAIRAGNSFEGNLVALANGRYLLLLLNPSPAGEQLLRQAAGGLQ